MATITQANRLMSVKTPLGDDVMLLTGFSGSEGLSQLFHYQLDVLVEHTKRGEKPIPKKVAIDDLLGKSITVEMALADGSSRFFNGICNRIAQGDMDLDFTSYRLELVPSLWLLSRIQRSRIFQPPESSVPQILKKVLTGIEISDDIQGTFHPRDYCVQYRETDLAFASRLMQEEGIYYYFKHEDGKHTMVLANTPAKHAEIPGPTELIYEKATGGHREEDRILDWSKMQELRSGKYTLWDHCFEKPDSHLDASASIQATVEVGEESHKLTAGNNGNYELYDYPGEYAQRFDGIDKGGGEKPADIEKIFEDNARTLGIRMQQEAVNSLLVQAASNVRHLVAGHKFTLTNHVNANGEYVLTTVTHHASSNLSEAADGFSYSNSFTCIPSGLPYRPTRVTPKPIVHGTHTAVVVGPAGEEIYTDKYSRVKVQFHWDREGKKDAGSSCWVRVATLWGGTQWGMIHIPRIGQEVVVDFLEGDPDQPIIIGSVYNANNMPPYGLPDNKTQSGIKSRSSLGGSPDNFNEIRFEDKKGEEQVFIHAEKNQDIEVENDETHWVGRDRKKTIDRDETTLVKRDRTETVDRDEKITIHGNRTEEVDKDETITIHQNRTETVDMNETVTVTQNRTHTVSQNEVLTVTMTRTHTVGINEAITVGASQEVTVGAMRMVTVGANQAVTIGRNLSETVGKNYSEDVGENYAIKVGKSHSHTIKEKLVINAGESISITTGKSSINMDKDGIITIMGVDITIDASGEVKVLAAKDMTLKGKTIKEN
jgi:type VI secretion system secreted protein VgrG